MDNIKPFSNIKIGIWVRHTNGSGMNREVHVPFCERLGVKFPWSTLRVLQKSCIRDEGRSFESVYRH